ncbi:acylphosphatase [uncultured Aquimarina sp.]|uniref:acylphosphatase n=1 Tax=uncultured Aquimarina sp. TaxID=575652 RepID=UPI00261F6204|nr:acylphosphatase [uncultured Aquimarina sp.]
MIKHYNIIVTGKVQGVWYRKSTLEKAQELGIKGIVKNLPNGDVYIEAEGDEDQLSQLLAWCADGPQFAKVINVDKKEAPVLSFKEFQIQY